MFISLQNAIFGALCKSSQQAEVKKLDSFRSIPKLSTMTLTWCSLQPSTRLIQQRAGRNATIEHPWPSRAWQTKAFMPLVGFSTYIDHCELGLELPNDDGVVLPVKKPTCLLTTRRNLFYHMLRFACSGNHQHTPCEGYIQGQGLRSRLCQDYPYEMAYELAHCMTQREETVAEINAAEDGDAELLEFEKARDEPLNPEEDKDCEMVKPTVSRRRRLEQERSTMSPDCTRTWVIHHPRSWSRCLYRGAGDRERFKQPGSTCAATAITGQNHFKYHLLEEFLQPLLAIAWWWTLHGFSWRQDVNVSSLCVMKQLAIAVRILQSEKSTEFIKGLERTWVRHFGLPKYFRVDAAKGWESKAVRDWCSDNLGSCPC